MLKHIHCPFCLLKGSNLQIPIYQNQTLSDTTCPHCGNDLPLDYLTEMIVLTVKSLIENEAKKDAFCRKCQLPKEFPLLLFCPHCKGEPYVTRENPMKEHLGKLRKIAWLPALKDYLDPNYFF